MPLELRVLSAAAEGIDVLQSTDHDFLLDYSEALSNAVKMGIVRADSIKVSVGDEVTPNHYGHFNVFPLLADPLDPEEGRLIGAHRIATSFTSPRLWPLRRRFDFAPREDPGEGGRSDQSHHG